MKYHFRSRDNSIFYNEENYLLKNDPIIEQESEYPAYMIVKNGKSIALVLRPTIERQKEEFEVVQYEKTFNTLALFVCSLIVVNGHLKFA